MRKVLYIIRLVPWHLKDKWLRLLKWWKIGYLIIGEICHGEILQPHRNDRVLWINLLTLHLRPDLLFGPSPQSSLLLTRPALKSVFQTRSLVGDKCCRIRMASRSGQYERIYSISQSRKKWLKSGRISKTVLAPPHLERSPICLHINPVCTKRDIFSAEYQEICRSQVVWPMDKYLTKYEIKSGTL